MRPTLTPREFARGLVLEHARRGRPNPVVPGLLTGAFWIAILYLGAHVLWAWLRS